MNLKLHDPGDASRVRQPLRRQRLADGSAPVVLAEHPCRGRAGARQRETRPPYRELAARPLGARECRRARRRSDGRADPSSGSVEGGRRYAAARCCRAALRARACRPLRRWRGTVRRMAGGTVGRPAGRGPSRCRRAPRRSAAPRSPWWSRWRSRVAIVATFVPAIRAAAPKHGRARSTTRPGRHARSAAVIGLSAHLPATLLLGVRIAVRRPRRLLLSVFSVAVTTSGLVAVLILHATSATWSLGPQVARATTIVSVMLIVLAAVNAVFIAWTTALEARHPAALARALGATPEQVTTGLSVAFLASGSPRSAARHPRWDRHLRRRQEWRWGHDAPVRSLACGDGRRNAAGHRCAHRHPVPHRRTSTRRRGTPVRRGRFERQSRWYLSVLTGRLAPDWASYLRL